MESVVWGVSMVGLVVDYENKPGHICMRADNLANDDSTLISPVDTAIWDDQSLCASDWWHHEKWNEMVGQPHQRTSESSHELPRSQISPRTPCVEFLKNLMGICLCWDLNKCWDLHLSRGNHSDDVPYGWGRLTFVVTGPAWKVRHTTGCVSNRGLLRTCCQRAW